MLDCLVYCKRFIYIVDFYAGSSTFIDNFEEEIENMETTNWIFDSLHGTHLTVSVRYLLKL